MFLCYEQYLVKKCFHLFKKLLWGYSFLWDFFNEVKKLMLKMINGNKYCRLEVIFYSYSIVYKGLWNRTKTMLVQSNTLDVITFFITVLEAIIQCFHSISLSNAELVEDPYKYYLRYYFFLSKLIKKERNICFIKML